MELKLLFIAVLFIGACAGFSLAEEQEDPLIEDEAQELEEMNNDAETDLEDPSKVIRPFCPKGKHRRCFIVTHCYRKLRVCRCFPVRRYTRYRGDEQVNDEVVESPEEFDEYAQDLEDPSAKRIPLPRPRCLKGLIRKCFFVKYGYSGRRIVCACVRPCRYRGDEAEADYY